MRLVSAPKNYRIVRVDELGREHSMEVIRVFRHVKEISRLATMSMNSCRDMSMNSKDEIGLESVPRKVRSKRFGIDLISKEDLPEYLKKTCNPFIHNHYRPELSLVKAIRTFLFLHNESVNIWSHTLGFFIMLALAISLGVESPPSMDDGMVSNIPCWARYPYKPLVVTKWPYSKWPIYAYLLGTMYVMVTSTATHVLYCMGERANKRMWKLDHTAITVAMYTMYFPWCVYAFDCVHSSIPVLYLTVTGFLAAIMVFIGLSDLAAIPKYQLLPPIMFIVFGFVGLAPMVHSAVLYWNSLCAVRYAFYLTFLQLFLNLVGGLAFSFRWPERYFPGRLDLLGNSHNIMHFAVVGAFVAYYYAALNLWKMRNFIGGC